MSCSKGRSDIMRPALRWQFVFPTSPIHTRATAIRYAADLHDEFRIPASSKNQAMVARLLSIQSYRKRGVHLGPAKKSSFKVGEPELTAARKWRRSAMVQSIKIPKGKTDRRRVGLSEIASPKGSVQFGRVTEFCKASRDLPLVQHCIHCFADRIGTFHRGWPDQDHTALNFSSQPLRAPKNNQRARSPAPMVTSGHVTAIVDEQVSVRSPNGTAVTGFTRPQAPAPAASFRPYTVSGRTRVFGKLPRIMPQAMAIHSDRPAPPRPRQGHRKRKAGNRPRQR